VNREFDPRQMKVAEACWEGMTEACWEGYRKKGMKKMFGKMYPNCVKVDEEAKLAGPETGSRLTTGSNQGVITTGITIPNSLSGKMKKKLKEEQNMQQLSAPVRRPDQPNPYTMQRLPAPVRQPGQPNPYTMQNLPAPVQQPGQPSPYTRQKLSNQTSQEQINEVGDTPKGKKVLASYIKKASHDVATKSAATGRYAERANKEEDNRKKNQDYSGYQQGRKDNAFADKMFKKSWKRREGIAKAADKLSKD